MIAFFLSAIPQRPLFVRRPRLADPPVPPSPPVIREINENSPVNRTFGSPVPCTDSDVSQIVRYAIVGGNVDDMFGIGVLSAQLFVSKPLLHIGCGRSVYSSSHMYRTMLSTLVLLVTLFANASSSFCRSTTQRLTSRSVEAIRCCWSAATTVLASSLPPIL